MNKFFIGFLITVSAIGLSGTYSKAATLSLHDFENVSASAYPSYGGGCPNPQILSENGNHFLRITTIKSDANGAGSTDPNKNRCQILGVGGSATNEGETVTYSFDLRFINVNNPDNPNEGGTIMELFTWGPSTVYGQCGTGSGPNIRIIGGMGIPFTGYSYYNNGCSVQTAANIGYIPIDAWAHYDVKVHWSTNTSGSVEFYQNGQLVGSLSGAPTIFGNLGGQSVEMDIGFYGVFAYGIMDFDNIKTESGGTISGTPPPPPPSSTPPSSTPPPPPIPSCTNLWDSSKAVPAAFGASFNWFSAAKELLMQAYCGILGGQTGAQVNVGNGSTLEYIYKTGYTWKNGAWSPLNYTGSSMDSGGNWFIGSASAQIPLTSAELSTKQSVLAYICDWNGVWNCGCNDSACATNYWNLQQFKQ